jgi:hypothetical protein
MVQVYAVLDDSDAVEDYELQREAEDPIAFAATGYDPDTLHYNAAMKAHDSEDFKVAMIKEANDHTTRSHWALWEKRNVPAGHKILSAIWAFKRKFCIDTRAVQGQDQRSWETSNLWSGSRTGWVGPHIGSHYRCLDLFWIPVHPGWVGRGWNGG